MGKLTIAFSVIAFLFFIVPSYSQISKDFYNQLPAELKPANRENLTDQERANLLNHGDRELIDKFRNDYKLLAEFADSMLNKSGDTGIKILYSNALGNYYISLFDDKKSFDYFIRSINFPVKNKKDHAKEMSESLSQLAIHFSNKNMQDTAIEYLNRAIDTGDPRDTAFMLTVFNGYFQIYNRLGLNHLVLEYLDKYISYLTPDAMWGEEYVYMQIGKAFILTNLFGHTNDTAYLEQSNKIIKEIMSAKKEEKETCFSACYSLLGTIELKKQNYKAALCMYDSCLKPVYVENNIYDPSFIRKAEFYKLICLYNLGDRNVLPVLDTFKFNQLDYELHAERLKTLYQGAMDIKDYRKALDYYTLYTRDNDSVNIMTNRSRVFEANQKYSVIRKEKEIEQLKNKNLLEKVKWSRIIYAVTIAGTLLLAGILALYSSNKKQQNKRLLESRRLLDKLAGMEKEMEMAKLEQQTEKEAAVTLERKNISRNMHDEIGSSLAALRFLIVDLKQSTEKNGMVPAAVLDELEQEAASIYEYSRVFIHQLNLNSNTEIYDVGELLSNLENKFGKDSVFRIKVHKEDGLVSRLNNLQHAELYRVIKESVANSMKHAHADAVEISLSRKENYINFEIRDNGKGFQKTKATEGIGLKTMRQRIQQLEGNIFIDSNIAGTSVHGSFPLEEAEVV